MGILSRDMLALAKAIEEELNRVLVESTNKISLSNEIESTKAELSVLLKDLRSMTVNIAGLTESVEKCVKPRITLLNERLNVLEELQKEQEGRRTI